MLVNNKGFQNIENSIFIWLPHKLLYCFFSIFASIIPNYRFEDPECYIKFIQTPKLKSWEVASLDFKSSLIL